MPPVSPLVSPVTSLPAPGSNFNNNLIFTSSGQVINPDLNTLLGTFTGSNSIAFVPDTYSRTSLLCDSRSTFPSTSLILKAFSIDTFLLVGSLTIPGVNGFTYFARTLGRKWPGVSYSGDQLFIIQTSLIPSAEPIPTPTPVVSPTPTPSPTPHGAFIRQVPLNTNDLDFQQRNTEVICECTQQRGQHRK